MKGKTSFPDLPCVIPRSNLQQLPQWLHKSTLRALNHYRKGHAVAHVIAQYIFPTIT
jgi:hypothetical protein